MILVTISCFCCWILHVEKPQGPGLIPCNKYFSSQMLHRGWQQCRFQAKWIWQIAAQWNYLPLEECSSLTCSAGDQGIDVIYVSDGRILVPKMHLRTRMGSRKFYTVGTVLVLNQVKLFQLESHYQITWQQEQHNRPSLAKINCHLRLMTFFLLLRRVSETAEKVRLEAASINRDGTQPLS